MTENLALLPRILAYILSFYALCLVSWAITIHGLPRASRLGLRLACVLLGQFALNAILVQALGLSGLLRTGPYLLISLGMGIAVSWFLRDRSPHRSLARWVSRSLSLWIARPPFGLGFLSLGCFMALVNCSSFVEGMDSLSIHGPRIIGWLQTGKVTLLDRWNYPICWEYQYVPNLLLIGQDSLVVVPRLLQAVGLLLLLKEVGSRVRLGGGLSQIMAWLCALTPLVWGNLGEGTFKNDTTFALGALVSLIALERVGRGRKGGFYLIQLGAFTLIGTKATGFVYAGLFFAIYLVLWALKSSRWHKTRPRKAAAVVAATVLFQATPLAVQGANFIENGNPVYPINVQVGEKLIFSGPGDLKGTSILDHATDEKTWQALIRSLGRRVGLELPILLVMSILGAVHIMGRTVIGLQRRNRLDVFDGNFLALGACTAMLWLLYFATPWSAGITAERLNFVENGLSLRYAIAPIGLTLLLGSAYLSRRVGPTLALQLACVAFAALLYHKWRPGLESRYRNKDIEIFLLKFLVAVLLIYGLWRLLVVVWARVGGETPRQVFGISALIFLLALFFLFAVRVEARRQTVWGASSNRTAGFRPIMSYVRNNVPEGSIIAMNEEIPLLRYFLFGQRLRNHLVPVHDWTPEQRSIPEGARYMFYSDRQRDKRRLSDVRKSMAESGWSKVAAASAEGSVLFARQTTSMEPSK